MSSPSRPSSNDQCSEPQAFTTCERNSNPKMRRRPGSPTAPSRPSSNHQCSNRPAGEGAEKTPGNDGGPDDDARPSQPAKETPTPTAARARFTPQQEARSPPPRKSTQIGSAV